VKRAFLLAICFAAASAAQAQSSGPFHRYIAEVRADTTDPRLAAFAHSCVTTTAKPEKIYLYTVQNSWLLTNTMVSAFVDYSTGDANTAEVWKYDGVPRVVYRWEVDMEYERDSLFCMDKTGEVTRAVSRFFPSSSGEPREHWTYVHTVRPGPHVNVWESMGIYEDAKGSHLTNPEVSSEDHDFIRGERQYHYWNDFDFATLVTPAAASAATAGEAHP
jgi:hypothetical protein